MKDNILDKKIKEMTEKAGNAWGSRVDGFVKEIKTICNHYAEKLGYTPLEVFQALELKRTYSYPNYYQLANFPRLEDVTVFKTQDEMMDTIQPKKGFRCPACKGVSSDPYRCNSGLNMFDSHGKCNWTSYGLFGTMGKGLKFTISENWIEKPMIDKCFMPVSMEKDV